MMNRSCSRIRTNSVQATPTHPKSYEFGDGNLATSNGIVARSIAEKKSLRFLLFKLPENPVMRFK
jgi:hypothetical protein